MFPGGVVHISQIRSSSRLQFLECLLGFSRQPLMYCGVTGTREGELAVNVLLLDEILRGKDVCGLKVGDINASLDAILPHILGNLEVDIGLQMPA